MANQRNYQKEMEQVIERQKQDGYVPALLLHSCCAPCSSYVLETLSKDFPLLFFIIIRIFILRRNTGSE